MYIVCTRSWINTFVCTWYIHWHELIYLYVHGTYMCKNVNLCMDVVRTNVLIHDRVCTMYILHVHEFISLYVHCTYTCIDVNKCLDTVQTRLYSFTTTIYFPSGPISLATPASLSSAQAPLLQSSLLPVISLLNWQTTQARLATSKLLQPRVYLVHIAATPAIRCCSVTGAHWEA
jgi:hypothetical protein